jgi:uncharacterized protein YdeI (YjbR/CyaY-like superfamily)
MPKTKKASPKKAATAGKPGPIRAFRTQQTFADWLEKNHDRSSGIWMRIAKKGSGLKTATYAEGLEVALCYGWIDGKKLPENEKTWLQWFVPRRPRSLWSKINRDKALALMASGRMCRPGLAEIDRAKSDGRWEAAYDSPSRAQVPTDLQQELDRSTKAKAFFEKLDRINRYAIIWRVQTARKAEIRAQRIRTLIEMLEKGKTLH